MCLLLIAYHKHPDYQLVVAANRDEFYSRPTSPVHWWDDFPDLLAGRDLKEGGTWLGITKQGKFAALTNFRDPRHEMEDVRSRGFLATDFLTAGDSPDEYLTKISGMDSIYNGFNLIWGTVDNLYCYSNRSKQSKKLTSGVYGLSNHFLDTPWPKVKRAKQMLESMLSFPDEVSTENIIEMLSDRKAAPDSELPDTGVGVEWERILSPIFVKSPVYGTRSSMVLLIDRNNRVSFYEKNHVPAGRNQVQFVLEN